MILFDAVLPAATGASSQLTIVERIKRDLKRPLDDDDVKLALIEQMRHWRVHRFHFNEATANFNLTDGTYIYGEESAVGAQDGYPADMIRPDLVYVRSGGTTWVPVKQDTLDAIRWENPQDTNNRGTPDVYAWYGEELYFSPVPNANATEVRLDYVKDIGTPTYEFDGAEWIFYRTEDSSSEWTEDSTNRWFLEGEELLRQATKRSLYMNLYEDMEGAQRMDAAVQHAWNRLTNQMDNYRSNIRRKPTVL